MPHDSISRYDGSADRYNVNSINNLKDPQEVLKAFHARSKDTLEPSQEKIDKEILNRLQASSSGIPHDKLPIVARAGKYIFMAVAMPSYLLIYSIPRWIAVHLIPNTCQMLNKGLKQCFRPLEELALQLTRQVQRLVKTIRQQMSQVTKTLSHLKGLMNLFYRPFEKLNDLWNLIKKRAQEKKKALEEFFATAKKKLLERFNSMKDAARRSALKMLYGRLSKDESLSPWRLKLLAILKTVQRAYRFTIELPKKIYEYIKQEVNTRYNKYIYPHVLKIQNSYRRIKARIVSIRQSIQKVVLKLRDKAKALRKIVTDKVRSAATTSLQFVVKTLHLPQIVSHFYSAWQYGVNVVNHGRIKIRDAFNFAKSKLKNPFKAIPNPFGKIKNMSNNIFTFIKGRYEKASKKLSSRASAFFELVRKNLKRVSNIISIKDRPERALSFKRLKRKAIKKVKRAIYYTRLTSSWTRILTGFWMVSVRNISEQCVEHLTWKDFIYFVKKIASAFTFFIRRTAAKTLKFNKKKRSLLAS